MVAAAFLAPALGVQGVPFLLWGERTAGYVRLGVGLAAIGLTAAFYLGWLGSRADIFFDHFEALMLTSIIVVSIYVSLWIGGIIRAFKGPAAKPEPEDRA